MSLSGSSTTSSWMTLAATRPCTGVWKGPLYPKVTSYATEPDAPLPATSRGAEMATGTTAIGLRTLWAPSLHVSDPNVHSSNTAASLLVNVTVYEVDAPAANVNWAGDTTTSTPDGASTDTL